MSEITSTRVDDILNEETVCRGTHNSISFLSHKFTSWSGYFSALTEFELSWSLSMTFRRAPSRRPNLRPVLQVYLHQTKVPVSRGFCSPVFNQPAFHFQSCLLAVDMCDVKLKLGLGPNTSDKRRGCSLVDTVRVVQARLSSTSRGWRR